MIKEIDELYYHLRRLEDVYHVDISNSQEFLAIHEAQMKLEVAISNVEVLITQLILQHSPKKSINNASNVRI